MSLQHIVDTLRAQPVLDMSIIAGILALLCAALFVRVERLKDRLHVAQAAAEDAARAAAMSAPGGIDPDVVVEMLRAGERPTLDTVYASMQRKAGRPAR